MRQSTPTPAAARAPSPVARVLEVQPARVRAVLRVAQPASRWGSLRSLWSLGIRRDSATTYSDASQADDEGLGLHGVQRADSYGKLHQMVNEADAERARARKITQGRIPSAPSTPGLQGLELEVPPGTSSSTQPIDVPLKMHPQGCLRTCSTFEIFFLAELF